MENRNFYSPWKLSFYLEELKKIRNGEVVSPVNLQIDLTNKCQCKCLFCFYDIHKHIKDFNRKDEILFEDVNRIVLQFKELGGKSTEFTGGGEPLLYPNFRDISRLSREEGLELALVTNGQLLHNFIDEVSDYSWVRVSLDAFKNATYKLCHGCNGEFISKVKDNIIKMCNKKQKKCILGISIITCKENWQEIYDISKFAKDSGADNIRISLAHTPQKEHIFDGIWDNVIDEIEKAKLLQNNYFKVFTFSNRIRDIARQTCGGFCYYHHFTAVVGANACLYPCCYEKYVPKRNLGSLYDSSFRELWHGEKRNKFINSVAKNCPESCWMTEKNAFADYLVQNKEDVPHINFP